LLCIAKLVAKDYAYKYVRANENGVHLRKIDGGSIIKTNTVSQLLILDTDEKIQHIPHRCNISILLLSLYRLLC